MNNKEIALKYINLLEKGKMNQIIDLFQKDGIVISPLYGTKPAKDFYLQLEKDTANSQLLINEIFESQDTNTIALFFTYNWTLKNNKKVVFDVIDIISFDNNNKINKLRIIYDTVLTRKLVAQMN